MQKTKNIIIDSEIEKYKKLKTYSLPTSLLKILNRENH